MKLIDANVLLHAVNSDYRQHRAARNWLTNALAGPEPVAFPWLSLPAFVRISTSARIFTNPLSSSAAFDLIELWLGAAAAVVVHPTSRHAGVLRGLVEQTGSAGNLTSNAHLAALAVEHGAVVVTFDRDFARFAVRLETPSAATRPRASPGLMRWHRFRPGNARRGVRADKVGLTRPTRHTMTYFVRAVELDQRGPRGAASGGTEARTAGRGVGGTVPRTAGRGVGGNARADGGDQGRTVTMPGSEMS